MKNYLDDMSEEDRRWSRTPEIMRKRPVSSEFTFAHRCADRAERFLSHHAEEDFLMVVSFDEPHDPYVCPEPYASMFKEYKFPKRSTFTIRWRTSRSTSSLGGRQLQQTRTRWKSAIPTFSDATRMWTAKLGGSSSPHDCTRRMPSSCTHPIMGIFSTGTR